MGSISAPRCRAGSLASRLVCAETRTGELKHTKAEPARRRARHGCLVLGILHGFRHSFSSAATRAGSTLAGAARFAAV